jgi:hypothetical protein
VLKHCVSRINARGVELATSNDLHIALGTASASQSEPVPDLQSARISQAQASLICFGRFRPFTIPLLGPRDDSDVAVTLCASTRMARDGFSQCT